MATLTQLRETTRFLEARSRSRPLAAEAARVMPDGITPRDDPPSAVRPGDGVGVRVGAGRRGRR